MCVVTKTVLEQAASWLTRDMSRILDRRQERERGLEEVAHPMLHQQ